MVSPNYGKLTNANLKTLLELRGLETGGTKVQMVSRLVMQDAEQEAANKATKAAVQATSTGAGFSSGSATAPAQNKGTSGELSSTERSRRLRKERLRRAPASGSMRVGGQVQGEDSGEPEGEDEMDSEAYVMELMAGGGGVLAPGKTGRATDGEHVEAQTGSSSGIIVNMTPADPPVRSRRTRWEEPLNEFENCKHTGDMGTITPVTNTTNNDDAAPHPGPRTRWGPDLPLPPPAMHTNDDAIDAETSSNASTIRASSPVHTKDVATNTNANSASQLDQEVQALVAAHLQLHPMQAADNPHDARTAFKVITTAFLLGMISIFIINPGTLGESIDNVIAFLRDPVGTIFESIFGPADWA